jgi:hypothetical protein
MSVTEEERGRGDSPFFLPSPHDQPSRPCTPPSIRRQRKMREKKFVPLYRQPTAPRHSHIHNQIGEYRWDFGEGCSQTKRRDIHHRFGNIMVARLSDDQ